MKVRKLLAALIAALSLLGLGSAVQVAFAAPTESCNDDVDNDGDGKIDDADPDCTESYVARCADGDDNDGDGKVDDQDPGCSGTNDDSEWDLCDDGKDNDGDGKPDEQDPQCAPGGGGEKPSACNDGKDNDGDGATDYPDDKGCSNAYDGSEKYACEDGTDNDGDGKRDYPADPGCASATDNSEYNPPPESCSDGIDNDRDGLVDGEDPDCEEPSSTTDGPCHRGEGVLGPQGLNLAPEGDQQNPLAEQAYHGLEALVAEIVNHPGAETADSETDNSALGDAAALYEQTLPLQAGPEGACALDLVVGTPDDN